MKILVREANWLGDAVMSIPTLAAIHNRYPDAEIVIAARETILPLFDLLPWEMEKVPIGSMKSWLRLRREKFDLAIIFPNSFRSGLEVFLTGARIRLGYATCFRNFFLTERVPINKNISHQVYYYYNLLGSLGIKGKMPSPGIVIEGKERIYDILRGKGVKPERPLITISPGASFGEAKCWPEENFAELIRRLEGEGEIVFAGSDGDFPCIERIISLARGVEAFNLAGETTLSELASLFSISKIVISNDNGSMHLAAILGVPLVALFGPTSPSRTGPLGDEAVVLRGEADCFPCKKRICHDKKCFDRITVDRVYEAVKILLRERRNDK